MAQFSYQRADFPQHFVFGSATSAYQIEGHGFGAAGPTHWDSFAATPGNVVAQENGAIACDHYHRFSEDFDLVAAAGLDAYRFSISWSRVIPDGIGKTNQEGLDFYDRLLDALTARRIKPFATLYHWEMPAVLADRGGWCNAEIVDWFGQFADRVVRRLGDRLHSFAPINEPWCVAWLSHYLGHHAPGMCDIRAATRAMHHVLLAQARAIEVARTHGQRRCGAVFNFEFAEPAGESDGDLAATECYDAIYNRWFLQASCQGTYPRAALEQLEAYLPAGWEQDLERIAVALDWIGVNYYTRKLIAADPKLPLPSVKEITGDLAQTAMGWEIYPPGLLAMLQRVQTATGGSVPIYVTENGMSAADRLIDGRVQDVERIRYIDDHLAMVQRALSEGIPVVGYFVWSLLDNFEWALGYGQRFGLVHVDFASLERVPKQSWHALASMLQVGR